MAKDDDVRAALERELVGYERMGDEIRAKQVRAQLTKTGRPRGRKTEKQTAKPAETTAERTGGLTMEDLGALGKAPAR